MGDPQPPEDSLPFQLVLRYIPTVISLILFGPLTWITNVGLRTRAGDGGLSDLNKPAHGYIPEVRRLDALFTAAAVVRE